MEPEKRDELIDALCQGSDRQIDDCVKPRLQALKDRPNNEELQCELLGIIDDCVFAALTSDFTIKVMHTMLMSIGYSEEKLMERNNSIKDNLTDEQKEVLQNKYKWQAAQHGW